MISMKFFFAFFLALIGTVASRELQQVRFPFDLANSFRLDARSATEDGCRRSRGCFGD